MTLTPMDAERSKTASGAHRATLQYLDQASELLRVSRRLIHHDETRSGVLDRAAAHLEQARALLTADHEEDS